MRLKLWTVHEEAVYANVYAVYAETEEAALEIVKNGAIDPEQRTYLMGSSYTVHPNPDRDTDLAPPKRDVFADTVVPPGPDPFSDE